MLTRLSYSLTISVSVDHDSGNKRRQVDNTDMANDDVPQTELSVNTKNAPKKKPKLQVSAREYDDISSMLLLGLKQLDETDTYDENIISINRYSLTHLLTYSLIHYA